MDIPYNEIDKELRPLIKALNDLDGIETTSCCFGHGLEPCRVWLKVANWTALIELLQRLRWVTTWALRFDLYLQGEQWDGTVHLILSTRTADTDVNLQRIACLIDRLADARHDEEDQQ